MFTPRNAGETKPATTLYLVSCVSRKRPEPCRARHLYTSEWFRKARAYVELTKSPWLILSAEYGLVDPDDLLSPYERTLNEMPVAARREWAARHRLPLASAWR